MKASILTIGDEILIGQIVDVSLDEARGFYFMGTKR